MDWMDGKLDELEGKTIRQTYIYIIYIYIYENYFGGLFYKHPSGGGDQKRTGASGVWQGDGCW